jgi:carbamoyltransferase
MLHTDALASLEGYMGPPNPFMTCAYRTKKSQHSLLQGVIGVDGSCRPQILSDDGTDSFTRLLNKVKSKTGLGVLLNTSLNIHGEPIVYSVQDALRTFESTEVNYLIINDYLVTKRG